MKQLLFIQGGGAGTHDAWDDKLVASLRRELGPAWDIRYPRMPNEADPAYAAWKAAIAEALAALAGGAIVVGHSLGGTFLISALAEAPARPRLAGIFLVAAPYVGPGGWPGDESIGSMESLGARLPPETPVHLYHGADDETAPPAHADLYAAAIPNAKVHRLPGRDHQLNDNLAEVAADIRPEMRGG